MTRPRLALDLHTLAGLAQGSRTYAWNLALRLPGLAPECDFVFYLPGGCADEAARLAAPNVTLRPLPGSRPARLLSFGARLGRDRADLVHCQYLAPPFLPCPSVLALHDVLHESHPRFYPGPMRALMRRLYPLAAGRAGVVLTCSEHSRREIVSRYRVPGERVLTIPLAADEAFRPALSQDERDRAGSTAARLGLRGRYVLFVGRVEPRKNVPALVRAFQALAASGHPDLTLAVAGQADPLFSADHARQLGQGDPRVAMLGRVSPEDLPGLYQGAALFAFASHAEGFGLPPLEAMACGTPVVCSNATSLPEVVGDAGLLVAPDDEAGLALAMGRVLADPALAAGLAAKGLARSRGFSWERTARQTLAAYRLALAAGAPPR